MKLVREKKLNNVEMCLFLSQGFKFVEKTSGLSPSTLFFGQKDGSSVFVKCWFDWSNVSAEEIRNARKSSTLFSLYESQDAKETLESLSYEVRVYKHLTKLVAEKKCFNFLPMFAHARCPIGEIALALDGIALDSTQVRLARIVKAYAKFVPSLHLEILSTMTAQVEKPTDISERLVSLKDFLQANPAQENVDKVMFQLLYALYVLEKEEIVHNDLHYGNILVEKLPAEQCVSITVEGKMIAFKTLFVPKIYDWDRAYSVKLGNNPLLQDSYYITVGQRNTFRPNMNLYMLIVHANKYGKSRNFFSRIADMSLPWFVQPHSKEYSVQCDCRDLSRYITTRQNSQTHDFFYMNTSNEMGDNVHIFTIDREQLEKFVDSKRLDILFNRTKPEMLEKYKSISVALLTANKTWTELLVHPGYGAIPLHDYTEPMLPSVFDLFEDDAVFEDMTENIEFCSNVVADYDVAYQDVYV